MSLDNGQTELDNGCLILLSFRHGYWDYQSVCGVLESVSLLYKFPPRETLTLMTITQRALERQFLRKSLGRPQCAYRPVYRSLTLHTRSIVIDYLRQYAQDKDVAITCIYCNYKEQAKQTVPELVASLLKQLVQDHPVVSGHVKSLYDHHWVQGTRPAHGGFTQALRSEIGRYSKVFIVVDALDELVERDQGYLVKELRSLADTVNLMVTSRPLPMIDQLFQGTRRVDILANECDVRTYIEVRTLREPRLILHVKGQKNLQESMVSKIIANVQGMYVYPVIFGMALPIHISPGFCL